MANINWNYSIPLSDKNKIDEIESKLLIKIPQELKELIVNYNAGYPSLSNCRVPGFGETDFKMLLSYNEDDDENIYQVIDFFIKKFHKRVLPFGSDSGSGYFCIKDDIIVYVSEKDWIPIPIAENLSIFLSLLF